MKKHYLFFVSVAYSYPILRPLQDEIRRRGDDVAWFIEPDCPVLLAQDERWLQSVQEVMDYQPIAVFAPGNYIYDFFPGVKVSFSMATPSISVAMKRMTIFLFADGSMSIAHKEKRALFLSRSLRGNTASLRYTKLAGARRILS